jgi:hypothetical protein
VVGSDISSSTTATDVPVTDNTVDDNIGSGTVEFIKTGTVQMTIHFTPTCDTRPEGMMCLNGFTLDLTAPTVLFDSASSGGVETLSPALIVVSLINAEAGQTYSVDYAVTGGTAVKGVDYNLVEPNVLTFYPGQTSKHISIDIVSDGVPEPDETIVLELSNPVGPGLILGTSEHTYTISDQTPTVSFATAAGSGPEDVTPALVQVALSHASNETVTVDYEAISGTATAGVDYNLPAGTLVLDPYETVENISIEIVDDSDIEEDETIILTLSNPTSAVLGTPNSHTHTIVDDESGLYWNGLIWYYSHNPDRLFVNLDGDLEWDPEKEGQFITRIPAQDISDVDDVVEISYWLLTDGDHDCPDCFSCDPYCLDDDITCIAGTSDFRFGMFEADGEYITSDGMGHNNPVFIGYKGYNWRFGPNMLAGPTRWVEYCKEEPEAHKTGNFAKKPVDSDSLMSINEGLEDYIPGFECPPGTWSLLTLRLERTSSSSIEMLITYNDRTYTWTDSSGDDQPSKIDVFGVHMRNGRPYYRLVLACVCGFGPEDFTGDNAVDERDLRILASKWLLSRGDPVEPAGNDLVVHYTLDQTFGHAAWDETVPWYDGYVLLVSNDNPLTTAWDPGGHYGGCLKFDGSNKVEVQSASEAFSDISSEVTVSLWVNGGAVQPDQNWGMVFHGRSAASDHLLYAHVPTVDGNVRFESGSCGAQCVEWTESSESDWKGQWNHYAFTLDVVDEHMVKIFHNGESVAAEAASVGIGGIEHFHVGCGVFGDSTAYEYFGKIDDFRIYDYALSEEEVMYLADEGQLLSFWPGDLYPPRIVDFEDFSVFVLQWLKDCCN